MLRPLHDGCRVLLKVVELGGRMHNNFAAGAHDSKCHSTVWDLSYLQIESSWTALLVLKLLGHGCVWGAGVGIYVSFFFFPFFNSSHPRPHDLTLEPLPTPSFRALDLGQTDPIANLTLHVNSALYLLSVFGTISPTQPGQCNLKSIGYRLTVKYLRLKVTASINGIKDTDPVLQFKSFS